ncbi:class I adenylate-forming enzyme family protein [Aspergillus lucknowensis]|uniref:AMP-dependent synthetase/ligase domain-containing protein n=1 Tax=Aspergillus lucknowensis TaxID=176173 RepID=A0ABR4L5H2_9EURO
MDRLCSFIRFKCCSSRQPAEIDGGLLHNEPSVFLHIERGLRQNPHGLAVISTHQPPRHLSSLVGDASHDEPCLAWTYTQLHRAALRVAGGLLAHGARSNSTMLLLVPNGVEYAVLLWMAVILRLTIVCLDPGLLDASKQDELRDLIDLTKPSIVVVQDEAGAGAVTRTLTSLNQILDQDILGITLTKPESNTPPAWTSFLTLATSPALSPPATASLLSAARADNPNRTHSIMFTSGTSGRPKGCPLRVSGMTHVLHSQSWLLNTENSTRALQQAHNSRGIAPAQTLQTWRAGGAVVMTGNGFDAGDLVESVRRQRVSFVVLTPAMVHAAEGEMDARSSSVSGRVDVDCVKTVQVGGDAVTREILERCCRIFPSANVVVNHGMTEGGGAFHWPFSGRKVRKIPFYGEMSPVGCVAAGAIVRIWDLERKTVCRRGQLGQLHVCCGSTIPEYLNGVSAESFYEEGGRRWFDTGDVAMMDRKGLVFILGRRKDMIRTKGSAKSTAKGVMPAPVESCLERFASQTCVVNVDGPFAVLESFSGRSEAQIRRHVVRSLGKQYTLRGVASLQQLGMSTFPVNATHKIIRTEVQAAVLKYLQL